MTTSATAYFYSFSGTEPSREPDTAAIVPLAKRLDIANSALPMSELPDAGTSDLSAHLERGLGAFGFESFRPAQREAIEALVEHRRLLLVAPTGGGKSLTYQLPASLLEGTSLVISPLIALMQDQVNALEKVGVPATYLASTMDRAEVNRRSDEIERGLYKIVYVAPERLVTHSFRALLSRIKCPLIAVDEAHCISEWGHDFRPEYLQIADVLRSMPEARILACTATATPIVRDEIVSRLGFSPETPQIVNGFARANLRLRALEIQTAKERRGAVDALLAEALGSPGDGIGTAIIYSPTRKKAEAEGERLKGRGWRVGVYHAGLDPSVRETSHYGFQRGDLDVVVATNAFGMGIDRGDVRAVVHLAPPSSVEAYYQEVGRAGRDGEPAYGLLLSSPQDLPLRRRLIESDIDGRAPDRAVVEHKWNLFLELMRWVEGGSCRHDAILRYFGDEAEELGGCGHCDMCLRIDTDDETSVEEVSMIARKALSGIARVHGRYGLTLAVKLLRGAADERLDRDGLSGLATFGVLKEHSEEWLVRLLRRCVTAGWVNFSPTERPVVLITAAGVDVMKGLSPARLILPPLRSAAVPRSPSTGKRRPVVADLADDARELFEALRTYRLEQSHELGVPPYVVASDRTLRDLAEQRPSNESELLLVHGIGPNKAERFGEGLLDVVRAYN